MRYENSNPQEIQQILIVENKVDTAQLNRKTGQMTDDWIENRVEKMLASDDAEIRSTGELIRLNPGLVRKELWHHDLNPGITNIHLLDDNAIIVPESKRTKTSISYWTRERCESKQPTIICRPISQ